MKQRNKPRNRSASNTNSKRSRLKQIMAFGVMTTPALVVDGQVKVSGKVPAMDEIKTMLQQTGK